MKANASSEPATVSDPPGFSASLTSASTMERITEVPGKGRSRAWRTALRRPSAPTR